MQSETITKANWLHYYFKAHVNYWSINVTRLVIKTYIRPILEYAVSAWNSGMLGDSCELEKIQRRLSKLCPEIKDLPYEERLKQLNLPSLKDRRIRGDQINLYKQINSNKILFNQFFNFNNLATRGHNFKLHVPRVHTDIGRRSFYFRVIDKWNSLPSDVVNASSVLKFKILYDVNNCCI